MGGRCSASSKSQIGVLETPAGTNIARFGHRRRLQGTRNTYRGRPHQCTPTSSRSELFFWKRDSLADVDSTFATAGDKQEVRFGW